MKTKFTVSMVVTVEHTEGTKVPKRDIDWLCRTNLLMMNLWKIKGGTAETTKVTIRSIDFD